MLPIQGTYNLRPAGSEPWLYRSAAIDNVGDDEVTALRRAGIELVIDLRDECERATRTGAIPVTHIPIYDLPDGPPKAGSLRTVYELMLFERGAELASAVSAIARADSSVLVHCTAGKDRTGLVVALALLAAGVAESAVIADYAASGAEVGAHRRDHVATMIDRLGLNGRERAEALELHLDSPADALASAIAGINRRFGSVNEYLLTHGVSALELARLRDKTAADVRA